MAMNPMKRKAILYMLVGIFATLLITGSICVFLFMQLKNLKDEKTKAEAAKRNVYVLKQDVKSGEILQADMFANKKIDSSTIPSNSTTNISEMIDEMTLEDQYGRVIIKNEEGELSFEESEIKIEKDNDGGYYYLENDNRVYIELKNAPIIAKVDMMKNTVITEELMVRSDEMVTSNLRKQEYNMIILPSQIESGDYVDIRLMLSNGADFIVASKKKITIPEIEGVPSGNTISLNMSEEEILVMNSAIIDAYVDEGSILYATTYVEAGMQDAALTTYIPSATVQNLIYTDDNIILKAKSELISRYNQNANTRTNVIEQNLAQYNQNKVDNIEAGVQKQITKARQERQSYLQSLGGY